MYEKEEEEAGEKDGKQTREKFFAVCLLLYLRFLCIEVLHPKTLHNFPFSLFE
jgi:hypothetical protein